MSVLAIDEESEILSRIADILGEAGYTCQCARDADSAQKATSLHQPDLIIANVNLGGRSGRSVCDELKELAGICDVPVMFLSAAQVPDVVRRQQPNGDGVYFLRKPFNASVLVQLVEKSRRLNPLRPPVAGSPAPRNAEPPKSASPRAALFARPSCRPSSAHGDRRFLPPGDRAHPPRGISAVRSLAFDAPTTRPIMALARRLAATARRAQGLQQSFNSRAIFLRGARSWKH